ncbi:hypothetical protein GALL_417340 [mine drainage metagenome]|uniref:Uncharacterized protein n=1 Tax=mine drainage metagenome TaxID=410659 RepID=A0A1J5QKN4_9ZZZZ
MPRGVAVRHVVEAILRAQPYADSVAGPDLDNGIDDIHQQRQALPWRAAIGVCALVAPVTQELVDQVTIGPVDFHPIEARFLGLPRGVPELIDHAQDLFRPQGPGCHEILHAHIGDGLAQRPDGGRRHRINAVGLKAGVRNSAAVLQLGKDATTACMNRLGHPSPGEDLILTEEPRGARVPNGLG